MLPSHAVPIRRAAVAGRWYPGSAQSLADAVDAHLANARTDVQGDLVALVAPHAGLMYSGPVAAHAYRLLERRRFDVAVLVGPSHFAGFDGVAAYPDGGFETPFGIAPIDDDCREAIVAASFVVRTAAAAHQREHSLEMQLPFVQRLAPEIKIVPLLMGYQTRATAEALGDALAAALRGRRALLIASTDLSHYHDAETAARMDGVVIDCVARLGGDEFAALLPETTVTDAVKVAARITDRLQDRQVAPRTARLTLNVGAVALRAGDTIVEALRRADIALEDARSRHHGRPVASRNSAEGTEYGSSQRPDLEPEPV